MEMQKTPSWLRAVEIVFGIIAIGLGLLVASDPGLGFATLILLLAVGLVFLGAREIAFGIIGTHIPGWLRGVSIVAGALSFVLSLIVISFPGLAALTLVFLLYFALFIRGLGLIGLGAGGKMMLVQHRGLSVGVGILGIILAIIFLVFPGLAILTLVFILAVGISITGIEAIWAGVTGRSFSAVITGRTTGKPSSLRI